MTLVIDVCQEELSRSEFVAPIVSIVGRGARIQHYLDLEPEVVEASEAVVICGTALRDDGYLEHLDRFSWLRTTRTPVLGICAGMQLIALANGGRLVPRKEIGMTVVEPTEDNPLVPEGTEVYSLHSYDLEGLEDFRVLARSRECVHAVVHRERPLWGVLFHPEVRRGNVVTRFLEHLQPRGQG